MIEILSNSAMFAEGWLSFVGSLVVAGVIFGSVKGWSGIRLATFWLLWQLSMPMLPVLEGGLMLVSGMVLSESLYIVCTRWKAEARTDRGS